MTEEAEVKVEEVVEETVEEKVEAKELSMDDAIKRIESLEKINKDVVKSRNNLKTKVATIETKAEKERVSTLEEQNKYKELYEGLQAENVKMKDDINTGNINDLLTTALDNVGCLDSSIALKLIPHDNLNAESNNLIVDAVDSLKLSSPILFGEKKIVNVPPSTTVDNSVITTDNAQAMRNAALAGDVQLFRQLKG